MAKDKRIVQNNDNNLYICSINHKLIDVMGFFYKHLIHPFLSKGVGKKSFSNNPYIGMIIDADENDVIADELFRLSLAYHEGAYMLPQDNKKAMYYCLKAAERGHAVAQLNAAQWLMRYHDDHSDDVLYWLQKAAEQGEPQSMYNLGISYHRGDIDGTTNIEASNNLFRGSAERGYSTAYSRMALIYFNGEGVDKNLAIAKYWAWLDFANMSEEEKDQAFLYHLLEDDDIIDGNKLNFRKIIEDAAKSGERDAINNWASGLHNSDEKENAFELFKKSADLGLPTGQCNLARQYWTEARKEYDKAFELFKKAAEQNYEGGFYGMAVMNYQGLGREKDVQTAWECLEKSLNMANDEARFLFAVMHFNNDLQEILPDKVLRGASYLELAALNGFQPAIDYMNNLSSKE